MKERALRKKRKRRLVRFFEGDPAYAHMDLEDLVLDLRPEEVEAMWNADRLTVEQYQACLDVYLPQRRIQT